MTANDLAVLDVEDNIVTLTLAAADTIHAGDTVTLDYTGQDPELRDELGNYLPSFTGQEVENLRGLEPPGAVENLTATGISTDTIKVDWDPPADVGGSAIIGYRIQGSDDGGNTYRVLRDGTTTATDTISEYIMVASNQARPGTTWCRRSTPWLRVQSRGPAVLPSARAKSPAPRPNSRPKPMAPRPSTWNGTLRPIPDQRDHGIQD